jgi:L-iditol 2-dehydrogenase
VPRPIANLSFQINGGYARYMKVPESMIRSGSVLRVPAAVTDEEACLVEPAACALESIFSTPHPVGVDAAGRQLFRAGIRPGGNVCIIGSGTVGLIYAALAHLEGAKRVFVLVRSEAKKKLVTDRLGTRVETFLLPPLGDAATPGILSAEDAVVRDLTATTDGALFDDVVCACASAGAQRLMLKLYALEGGAVGACFGGTHRRVDGADLDINHYRAAKTIGTSGCSTRCMQTILAWLAEGRLHFDGFTSSRRFSLDDDPHEFLTTEKDGLKPVIEMNGRDR